MGLTKLRESEGHAQLIGSLLEGKLEEPNFFSHAWVSECVAEKEWSLALWYDHLSDVEWLPSLVTACQKRNISYIYCLPTEGITLGADWENEDVIGYKITLSEPWPEEVLGMMGSMLFLAECGEFAMLCSHEWFGLLLGKPDFIREVLEIDSIGAAWSTYAEYVEDFKAESDFRTIYEHALERYADLIPESKLAD